MNFHKLNLDENTVIRVAEKKDKEKFMSLWKECFPQENDDFTSWIFNERFTKFPEYSVCIEKNGEIICSMQSYPLTMKIRNAEVPATIVGGVCTKPTYRGMGLMKKMFTYYMNYIRTLQIDIVTYKPVDLNVYKNLTHYPITDCAKFEITNDDTYREINNIEINNIENLDISENLEKLYECYNNFTEIKKYSCIIKRTFEDFCLKMQDYLSDNMACVSRDFENKITSYAMYKKTNEKIYIEEFISINFNDYNNIISNLISNTDVLNVSGKIPPDIVPFINLRNFTYDISFQNLAGAVNVPSLLKNVINKENIIHIDVKDEFVPENNNIFDLNGNIATEVSADFEINSGHLVQLICGYKTFYQLNREGCIKSNNENIYQKVDEIFTKTTCFTVDEY